MTDDKKIAAQGARTLDKQATSRRWLSDTRARQLDDAVTAKLAGITGGLPPARIVEAYVDWLLNLATSPGRQLQILETLLRGEGELLAGVFRRLPPPDEPRFATPGWQRKPFSLLAQLAAKTAALADLATAPLPGMDRHNADLVRFYTRQIVEALSPANFPLSNPDVLAATRAQRGRNLLRGARHAAGDVWKTLRGQKTPPSARYRVGETVAATPGKVIFRNELIELIQYMPTTDTVYTEPVLIVPAWIMKYYILDLSPQNSMIKWLVAQGHTVFTISWKNPDPEDRELTMEDYRQLGVLDALAVVNAVLPRRKVHAVGYCVGGTLLSITAAAMARDGDERLKTVTMFAAQTDFEEAGELKLFIDEMTLHWLDRQMAKKGVLESSQMGVAFNLLRPRDLIWSPIIANYFLGERADGFDIMAWNADGTRMPHRMHTDYLRQLYLENRLAQGKYRLGGKTVSLGDLRLPLFAVGTVTDHVAPWKSVYKIRNLKRLGETCFVLTTGGHNAGIVSEPGRARRTYRIGRWDENTAYASADEWAEHAESCEGSWWPAWQAWLVEHSGRRVAAPAMGNGAKGYSVLGDAPGAYVMQR